MSFNKGESAKLLLLGGWTERETTNYFCRQQTNTKYIAALLLLGGWTERKTSIEKNINHKRKRTKWNMVTGQATEAKFDKFGKVNYFEQVYPAFCCYPKAN